MTSDAAARGRSTARALLDSGVAVLAAFWCSSTAADPPPAPLPALQAAVEDSRAVLDHRVDAFVRAVTRNPGFAADAPLVRWNTPICFQIAGWAADELSRVSARLSEVSSSAGAPLARAPCQSNFVVVATSQPDRVLDAWSSRNQHLFGDATPAQIRQFRENSASRPVRVWYNIDQGRKSGVRNGHFVPSNTRAESSAFVRNAAFDFISVFAIVDTAHTGHATLDQLADYVAMAGLTNLDPEADVGTAPSILRLFSSAADGQPTGLGKWDTAFLSALYRSDQASRSQRLEIAESVARELSR
jgi:hypothetical protein